MARGKRISDDARAMIVSAYKFFLEGRKEDAELAGRTREVVAKCLGTSESSVYRVVKQHKAKEDSTSVEVGPQLQS
ncbi:hypothetical protein DVH05_017928 [Phytophthora capsici]|nr:hypothetical protein DVH05_017928 [Phytophthora capsici]